MNCLGLAVILLSSASYGATTVPAASKPCYWYEGFDARGDGNTDWMGPGANNCTVGARSRKPCTKEDCCAQCQTSDPSFVNPKTGQRCAFPVWNPSASACFFKTAGAVLFQKAGDGVCCPAGTVGCPSAPEGGKGWKLRRDLSDEFPVDPGGSKILPINQSKWNTSVASWGDWTWAPENVRTVAQVPTDRVQLSVGRGTEIPNASGYAALTMSYEEHNRSDGKTYYYKSAIMKSTVPSGITYGRFEARIKGASRFPGVCPAWWAWRGGSANGTAYWTELDFVEMQESSDNAHDIDFTTHVFPPTPGVSHELNNGTRVAFDFDPRDDFHIYAMEWNASRLTWWVDGTVVKRQPAAPYFNRGWPMDIALSFGLRPPLNRDHPGGKPNATGFPTTFYVDWVRVWQREDEQEAGTE